MNEHTATHPSHPGTLSSRALKVLCAGLACLTTFVESADGQDTSANTVNQPYLVFVSDTEAHLRCGPSGEYYKTDPVRHGQELEVYVETSDGWLGVRPVEESFCWVDADAVKLNQPSNSKQSSGADVLGTATVTEDKTVAWIGTNLGRARRYRWQVQLGAGEEITIVGSSEREGPDGPQTWYRIVPPSGEFRWIHQDQTAATAEALVASLKRPEPAQHMFIPDGNTEPTPTPAGEQPRVAMSQFEADVADENWDLRTDSPSRTESLERSHPRRELADRVARLSRGEEQAHPGAEVVAQAEHHPRSLSDRIARGLESLVGGGSSDVADLEPVTQSSRRIPDLVPIEEHRVASAAAMSQGIARVGHEEPVHSDVVGSGVAPNSGAAAQSAANLAAAPSLAPADDPAESSMRDSRMTITSRPRMVDGNGSLATTSGGWSQTPPSGIQQVSATFPAAPPKLRTIAAAQIEQVQRDVAQADVSMLPVLFSKLMARGASAPEVALVAEAAERLQLHALATRCREYQVVAQRRDGETVVQTMSLPTPMTPVPTIPSPVTPISSMATAAAGINGSMPRAAMNAVPSAQQAPEIATVSHEVPSAAPAALPVHEGTLVEVYSADPSRPPYAITDRGGRTLAYVTPAPGVDVHSHLGATIRVTGESGYLKGIDTPHVLATSAARIVR
ncbi:hypothetical protein [Rhodopirellula sp. P2]|uniref:hypothetical protein n=1 Tax=Rhodopirellula sp. P2 TaxID=2127060 RepID=UPI002367C344|nr:hypothetical protein [Rhodopirellula sp. P2]WDQ19100.1 hypothetical protein PSR62_11295 [Rhodopirellula sp. P2]